ncbi:UDP-N-acetylmuramoyl-L-alanine--D-glutamate ligase [Candidatus Uhrbacteria bacterium]|nr:UDP-N-acetylmuramoyl-L-alanine--D-glutamate ligase [Candidatus Uhrbacteria bacterium]
MIPIHKGTRVTVVGLGVHGGGVGSVRWLLKQGATVCICDRKSKKELPSSVAEVMRIYRQYKAHIPTLPAPTWRLGTAHTRSQIARSQLIVVNPDVPRTSATFQWAAELRIPIRVGDTTLFVERFAGRIIGITGTRGKTTTTTLIGNMMRGVHKDTIVAGNLRISPLDFLQRPRWAVLELSSWQVEGLNDIKKSPHIAVMTNIAPDHLNRYPSMAAYARAKSLLLKYQQATDHAVLNYDQTIIRAMASKTKARKWWVSSTVLPKRYNGAYLDRGRLWIRTRGVSHNVIARSSLRLDDDHVVVNMLFAIAAATAADMPRSIITQSLRKFRGVWGRNQRVRMVRGVEYINDTAATIPEATQAAIRALLKRNRAGKIILLAGGMDKGLDYMPFLAAILPYLKALVFFRGNASDKMREIVGTLQQNGGTPPRLAGPVASMESAVLKAAAMATPGDVVLLSPAAASFGIFRHAYDRGQQFERIVRGL